MRYFFKIIIYSAVYLYNVGYYYLPKLQNDTNERLWVRLKVPVFVRKNLVKLLWLTLNR